MNQTAEDVHAFDALGLTPLFSRSQLLSFERFADTISRKRSIDSGTLSAFVYAGIAVGYAHGRGP